MRLLSQSETDSLWLAEIEKRIAELCDETAAACYLGSLLAKERDYNRQEMLRAYIGMGRYIVSEGDKRTVFVLE